MAFTLTITPSPLWSPVPILRATADVPREPHPEFHMDPLTSSSRSIKKQKAKDQPEQKQISRQRKWQLKQRLLGRCPYCAKKTYGKYYCDSCSSWRRQRERRRYELIKRGAWNPTDSCGQPVTFADKRIYARSYYDSHRDQLAVAQRDWRAKYKLEHGISYSTAVRRRREIKLEVARARKAGLGSIPHTNR